MCEEANILSGVQMADAAEQKTARRSKIKFDDAFTLYHRMVFRVARGVVTDDGLAEDVTQEVFIRLYKNLDNAPNDDLLKAWLIRVTINAARNALRGNLRATAREDKYFKEIEKTGASVAEPELDYERKCQIEQIRQALAKIKEPLRSCLILKQQGFSYKEIAAALDLTENGIGSYIARARREFLRFYRKV
jgi:RNA polymerase sigma factor (sigma-70 family)